MVTVSHHKARILNGRPGAVSHGILVEFTSGGCALSTVWPGKEPRWDVFTAGGELVAQYADVNLAAHHAEQLTGNQIDMGAGTGHRK